MNNGSVNKKRLVIRLVLLALLVLLCFFLYYYGKEHEILLDNKTVEINGQSYAEAEYMLVIINGDEENSTELYPGDRDVVKLTGPKQTIKVQIVDENTEEVKKEVERTFNFGRTPMLMISLPALAEDAPDVYLPLSKVEDDSSAPVDEQAESDETTEDALPVTAPDGSSTNAASNEPATTD